MVARHPGGGYAPLPLTSNGTSTASTASTASTVASNPGSAAEEIISLAQVLSDRAFDIAIRADDKLRPVVRVEVCGTGENDDPGPEDAPGPERVLPPLFSDMRQSLNKVGLALDLIEHLIDSTDL